MKAPKQELSGLWEHAFFGSATIGERGQLVIPAEARAEMDMKAGDKLLIMRHPAHKGIMLFKIEAVREFLDDFQSHLEELERSESAEQS